MLSNIIGLRNLNNTATLLLLKIKYLYSWFLRESFTFYTLNILIYLVVIGEEILEHENILDTNRTSRMIAILNL